MAKPKKSASKAKKGSSASPEPAEKLKGKHAGKADSAKKAAKKAVKKAEGKVKAGKSEKTSAKNNPVISPEQRNCMISEAAYYRAEHRGFSDGTARDDWVKAEAEIDRRLSGK